MNTKKSTKVNSNILQIRDIATNGISTAGIIVVYIAFTMITGASLFFKLSKGRFFWIFRYIHTRRSFLLV